MSTKRVIIAAVVGMLATSAHAQTPDRTKAYIDSGFASMDANKDGSVTAAEFDSFMRARLARQSARFDAAFAEIDANKDGKITPAEAKIVPQLATNFAVVDTNGDKSISKTELQAAAADAQAEQVAAD